MIRLKKIFVCGGVEFVNMNGGIGSAFATARNLMRDNLKHQQVDIYDGTKLIASIYG